VIAYTVFCELQAVSELETQNIAGKLSVFQLANQKGGQQKI